MFRVYSFPPDYLPFWNVGVRLALMHYGRFLARLKAAGKTRMLDVGAGAGWNSLVAGDRGFTVSSLDMSENSVRALNSLAEKCALKERVRAQAGNCYHLPFPDASFDLVVSAHIIEHLDKPVAMLEEIGRVLKPGGCLLLSCPSLHHWMKVLRLTGVNPDPPDHKVIGYDEPGIRSLLPAGLSITRFSYQGRGLESNLMDIQGILSMVTGIRANPLDKKNTVPAGKPAWYVLLLYWAKEIVLVPFILACMLENALFPYVKGSMITLEIEKKVQ